MNSPSTHDPAMMICYRECLSNLMKFTGGDDEKIIQFVNNIERIGKMIDAGDNILYCMSTAKLDGEAKRWYENNSSLNTWDTLKTALLERFTISDSSTKVFEQLKERKQRPNESITSFYDSIIKLCHDYDPKMSEKMIVSWLENGVKESLKVPIKRQMKLLTETARTTKAFLKIAKDEQELQEEHSLVPDVTSSYVPYFGNTVSTTIPQPRTTQQTFESPHSHEQQDESKISRHRQPNSYKPTQRFRRASPNTRVVTSHQRNISAKDPRNKPTSLMAIPGRQLSPCLICKRNNHRTIDCYHKKSDGCYKCGQSDHRIRNCPAVFY
ncbi:unnamed protein product [Adineta ricciae]|uniref:CCHC-type domain-containing protein n=2 Tax=Adineta ricciae TaxID=249248 RepID=A0A816H0Z2_ADIRI|nr:unnamed protein product [Adineta ricciae]